MMTTTLNAEDAAKQLGITTDGTYTLFGMTGRACENTWLIGGEMFEHELKWLSGISRLPVSKLVTEFAVVPQSIIPQLEAVIEDDFKHGYGDAIDHIRLSRPFALGGLLGGTLEIEEAVWDEERQVFVFSGNEFKFPGNETRILDMIVDQYFVYPMATCYEDGSVIL